MLNKTIISWFPLLIFLAAMVLPISVNQSSVTRLTIPLLVAVWLCFAVYQWSFRLPKLLLGSVSLLILSQLALVYGANIGMPNAVFLGLLWVVLGVAVWALMREYKKYAMLFSHLYLVVASVWLLLALVVWVGGTLNGAPVFLGTSIALTSPLNLKMSGPFFNSNVFSILMLCAWCIASCLMMRVSKHQWAYALLSLLFLLAMFSGMSRGTWLSWLIVACLLMVALLKMNRKHEAVWLVLSALLAWFFASMLVSYVSSDALDMADKTSRVLSPGVRVTLYTTVLEVWKEHWFFGVGFGNLIGHYLTGQVTALAYLPSDALGLGATSHAHNHLLQVLAEAGITGLLLWGIVTYALLKGFWNCRFAVASQAWCFFAVAFVLWFQGLFNVSMLEPIPFFLFCMSLGLGMAFQQQSQQQNSVLMPKLYVLLVLVGTVVVLAYQTQVLVKNLRLYSDMIWQEEAGTERAAKVIDLMAYEYTYPLLIQQVVSDILQLHNKEMQLVALQPLIHRALAMEEWPALYQALFYSYVLQQEWDKACDLGGFMLKQHWAYDWNEASYRAACAGEDTNDFMLGITNDPL